LVLCIGLFVSNYAFAQNKEEIVKVLMAQQDLWNKGDVEGFMEYYWKSEELKFIGKNGVTKGWYATLQRYKTTYPDLATMGTLAFDIKEIDFHSKKSAWILGAWYLKRPEKGDVGGYFTLILKKIGGRWLIVSDHTS
jgi:ketosteroid isomerase-like protein